MDCPVFGVNPSRRDKHPQPQLRFCYRPQSLMLTIQTCLVSDHLTNIKVKLYTKQAFNFPCQASWERSIYNSLPLPQLVSPPNTNIQFRRRSSSNFDWRSRAEIQTYLTGPALLAHYNTQLTQAGWTQQVSDTQEQLLWSIWTLHDQYNQVWQICLSFVSNGFRSNQYVASLQGLNLNELSARSRVYPEQINKPVPESISEDLLWQLFSNSFPLANHYQSEMQEAGWEQQATSQKGYYHLSLWSFTDEQGQLWQGFLNLLGGLERTSQYIGLLTIEPLNSSSEIWQTGV